LVAHSPAIDGDKDNSVDDKEPSVARSHRIDDDRNVTVPQWTAGHAAGEAVHWAYESKSVGVA
jgi:hypothetical protein